MIPLDTAYFVLACLLLLSIVTVSLCRRDAKAASSYEEFLFDGKTFFYSVVSSAGAVFSVTYLLGATFIYATIYRGWTILIAVAVVSVSFLVIKRIISLAARAAPAPSAFPRENILLRFASQSLAKKEFSTFIQLLSIAFFLLLVEELAISRVVLSAVMVGLEPVSAGLLFIIIAVVLSYVHAGGFRAVLNADLVQGTVLVAFLFVLAYYVSQRSGSLVSLAQPIRVRSLDIVGAATLWTIYGTAFLVMAVDLFSRLNFAAPARLIAVMRTRLVAISLALVLIVITAGIAFGLAASAELGTALDSATHYYKAVVGFFMASDSVAIRTVFVIGLFCMIFTTVNTLLLTVMQIRFYSGGLGARRQDMLKLLVLAVFVSILVNSDAVCAFGIFAGAILLLPFSQIAGLIFPPMAFLRRLNHLYLWVALVLATAITWTFRSLFLEDFTSHYFMPGIMILSGAASALVFAAARKAFGGGRSGES